MWNTNVPGNLLEYKEAGDAARSMRLQLQSVEVSSVDDFERAFSALKTGGAEALIVAGSGLTSTNAGQIANLAMKHRLPTMVSSRDRVDAGGLIAYGPNLAELWRRAAAYVDKSLKGAKPGDLPIERPTKFELIINLKTAKALGIDVSLLLQQRADELIE